MSRLASLVLFLLVRVIGSESFDHKATTRWSGTHRYFVIPVEFLGGLLPRWHQRGRKKCVRPITMWLIRRFLWIGVGGSLTKRRWRWTADFISLELLGRALPLIRNWRWRRWDGSIVNVKIVDIFLQNGCRLCRARYDDAYIFVTETIFVLVYAWIRR